MNVVVRVLQAIWNERKSQSTVPTTHIVSPCMEIIIERMDTCLTVSEEAKLISAHTCKVKQPTLWRRKGVNEHKNASPYFAYSWENLMIITTSTTSAWNTSGAECSLYSSCFYFRTQVTNTCGCKVKRIISAELDFQSSFPIRKCLSFPCPDEGEDAGTSMVGRDGSLREQLSESL